MFFISVVVMRQTPSLGSRDESLISGFHPEERFSPATSGAQCPNAALFPPLLNKSSLGARSARRRKAVSPDPALPPELTLAITHVPLSSLSEYRNNPRTHSPEQIQQIADHKGVRLH